MVSSNITPEKAVQMASLCSEIEQRGGGRYGDNGPIYWIATLWCNAKGEHVTERGDTALDAVVNVHNKVNRLK